MSGYVKFLMQLNICLFLIKNEKFLRARNRVCDKNSNIMQEGFDIEPVCNEECLKAKLKSYDGKMNTNFRDNGVPR